MAKARNRQDTTASPRASDDEIARRRIATEANKNFLVEAAAGTGKTTCIVNRMVHLIESGACEIQHMAAVTFTRKAAAELRDRFHRELRRRRDAHSASSDAVTLERLTQASDHCHRGSISTIHSFCASLLRERPVEFDVSVDFRELDDRQEEALLRQAWLDNLHGMIAVGDPLLQKLDELGVDRELMWSSYLRFVDYRDVPHWPSGQPAPQDLAPIRREVEEYVASMRRLAPLFPKERGHDNLMNNYEKIIRTSEIPESSDSSFFELLELFDQSPGVVQKRWHSIPIAKSERDRWEIFRQVVVEPALRWWYQQRYCYVIQFLQRAASTYDQLKRAVGGLDFNDLLLRTASGLRRHPLLQDYFRKRYTHLLIDEFQDTDPLQAEIMIRLTSPDGHRPDWQQARPFPGSLFVVGDPKQSIYRFRRGDIITYNRFKQLVCESGGEVLRLTRNFRSCGTLIGWNNRTFESIFGPVESDFGPAAESMEVGHETAISGQLDGLAVLPVAGSDLHSATCQEADAIANFIASAISRGATVSRTRRELDEGRQLEVTAGDFMIITPYRPRIEIFQQALECRGITCDVSGSNAIGSVDELQLLILVLKCVDDPLNPILFAALLRDRLFGLGDDELLAYRLAGGRYTFLAELPAGLDAALASKFREIRGRLTQYQLWLRKLPFLSAIERISTDLGLIANSALAADGNQRAGGILKSIEWLRHQSHDFDTVGEMVECLEQVIESDESEPCTALPPTGDAVRIMNLHKCKGLEAPVVFLADTNRRYMADPRCHIDRTAIEPLGFMGIQRDSVGYHKQRSIAIPEGWEHYQEKERQFLDAEYHRLLYVAATRASSLMVVSQDNGQKSFWAELAPELARAPTLDAVLATIQPSSGSARASPQAVRKQQSSAPAHGGSSISLSHRWLKAQELSYETESAKDLGLQGKSRPRWSASGAFGYRWGTAMHELLRIAAQQGQADLVTLAPLILGANGLDPLRSSELLQSVNSVMGSAIWLRAAAATERYAELPFEMVDSTADGRKRLIRGVIDLLFREVDSGDEGSWVIVDYKTDEINSIELAAATQYYAGQVEEYAARWEALSAERVSEIGLYFTCLQQYVRLR